MTWKGVFHVGPGLLEVMEACIDPSHSARTEESRSCWNRRIPGNKLDVVMFTVEALGLERHKVFQDWETSRNYQPQQLWGWLNQ